MPWEATSPEDADNPYAPPRADTVTPLNTGESETEGLRRKLAPLESFAKAVGIECFIYAIFEGYMAVVVAGCAILGGLGAIVPWPVVRPAQIIAVEMGALIAVMGRTAGRDLRQLRSRSSSTLGALALALVLQSVVFELPRLALVLQSVVFGLPWHNLAKDPRRNNFYNLM